MSEAINKFYISNAKIKSVDEWEDYSKKSIIYEVIKIINGKPLFYYEHYKRLVNSLKLKGEKIEVTSEEMFDLICQLVNKNGVLIGNIKIIYNLLDKELRIFFIKHNYPDEKMYSQGVDVISYFGERHNPNVKEMDVDFRNNVNKEIKNKGVYEALLVDNNGLVTEGSRSNMFFIKGDIIYTSKSNAVLPGVTRTEILKEADKRGISIKEVDIKFKELSTYEAAFISGTSPNILPIKKIDEKEFDVDNRIMRELMNKFNLRIKEDIC